MKHTLNAGCIKLKVETEQVTMYRVTATDIITNTTVVGQSNISEKLATKSAISKLERDVSFKLITNNSLNRR